MSATEADDPYCLSADAAAELLRGAPWRRLAGVGDSIVAGLSDAVDGYADRSVFERVGDALRAVNPDTEVLNLGVAYLRTAQIAETQLERALAFRPDVVYVSAGGNDAIRRRFDPDALRRDLRALLDPLVEAASVVAFTGMFDLWRSGVAETDRLEQQIERFDLADELTREVAREAGAVFVDLHHHPLAADPSIFASDLVHANARGHAVAAAETVRALATRIPRPGA